MVNKPDPATAGLDVYIVGGAVRDALMGCDAGDRDWVVVGSSPEEMLTRGFTPVGSDFPVFLHPVTHEEYALARTERKSGHGYKGFTFYAGKDITLEQDLRRRDLTINAIARDASGNLFDPLGGQQDIGKRVLRHIGNAFTEDPVRLLRLARFAARFDTFEVAAETMALCKEIVASGEVDALVPERVWQEFTKGLATVNPGRMITLLNQCGALSRLVPELVWNQEIEAALSLAVASNLNVSQRFAVLCANSGQRVSLRAPSDYIKMAQLLPGLIKDIKQNQTDAVSVLAMLTAVDAARKPERCMELLRAARCFVSMDPIVLWQERVRAINSIDAGLIARQAGGNVALIKENIKLARIHALEQISIK